MSMTLSPNTQAILLLTAPLIAGRAEPSSDILTPSEYKRLARFLRERQRQPADLLAPDDKELFTECQRIIDNDRLNKLLTRGFLLSQVVERWHSRAIWVVSRADAEYPGRLKTRLKDDAPPILYGCGDAAIMDTGGLAVVGSRNVGDELIEYTEGIGRLAAQARRTLISGGARGIDQAAMRGAQEAGGKVAVVLADSLERDVLNRENRNLLMNGQLVLISPYDPMARFNVGYAMQRNKLIYALADAALVVSSDYKKGGTWDGAREQLEKLRLVPVYVRSNGETGKGLDALHRMGAKRWPNPKLPEELAEMLSNQVSSKIIATLQDEPLFSIHEEPKSYEISENLSSINGSSPPLAEESPSASADELSAKKQELLSKMKRPMTPAEVAAYLPISEKQAKKWLQQLVKKGVLEKHTKPERYVLKSQCSLFK
jgi:predicted Rossmann fold nucleotide-binding protein DprA/Smf involved in DNA uptake